MTEQTITAAKDSRVRRLARKHGYILRKCRGYSPLDNHGGYMLVDPSTSFCVAGSRYDLEPSDVEEWLTDG